MAPEGIFPTTDARSPSGLASRSCRSPTVARPVVFDATGSAASMAASLEYVAPVGRLGFVGISKEPVWIDDPLFHKREMTLYASRNSCHQFPRIIQMIEQGRIDTSPWITNRLSLAEVPRLFAELRQQPGTIKAMIEVAD